MSGTDNCAIKVLIVDDMKVNRMILSSMLSSYGIGSDSVESGTECIKAVLEYDYDLILLDHRMPDIDGVDTLIQLKKIFKGRGRDIPVICHTGSDARNNLNLYKAAGFKDVIFKPIEPKEMLRVILRYLPEDILSSADLLIDSDSPISTELAKLPAWLKSNNELDISAGLTRCETADDYMKALMVFYSSIDEKAAEIERFIEEDNIDDYVLRVHSLKSMARLIGADSLSIMASDLEQAGKERDLSLIKASSPLLLKGYRSLKEHLAPLEDKAKDTNSGKKLPPIPEDELKDAYMAISDFIKCYDEDSILMTLDSLCDYSLPEDALVKISSIQDSLRKLDWAELRDIMSI